MNKKVVLIIVIGIVILAAGTAVWVFLDPVLTAKTQSSPVFNDAWKLERIQGSWACEDDKYELSIDGCDYALKFDGVYAMVASVQFDASEKLQEGEERFTLQIDPSSVIYPDLQDADFHGIDALWYEDGMIYMRPYDAKGDKGDAVCLVQIETETKDSIDVWSQH